MQKFFFIIVFFSGLQIASSETERERIAKGAHQAKVRILQHFLDHYRKTGNASTLYGLQAENLGAELKLPVWTNLLKTGSPAAKQVALSALKKYPAAASNLWREAMSNLEENHTQLNREVAEFIAFVAPKSSDAVRALTQRLKKDIDRPTHLTSDVRISCMKAIECIGLSEETGDELRSLLEQENKHKNIRIAYQAYRTLGSLREQPEHPTKAQLMSPETYLESTAYHALEFIRLDSLSRQDALDAIHFCLSLDDLPRPQRRHALHILGNKKPDDPKSAKYIMDAYASDLGAYAVAALKRFKPGNPMSLKQLIRGLRGNDWNTLQPCGSAIRKFGDQGAVLVPDLLEILKATDEPMPIFRVQAVLGVLQTIGPQAKAASPLLHQMLDPAHPIYKSSGQRYPGRLQRWVVLALANIGINETAAPVLANFLKRPHTIRKTLVSAAYAAGCLPDGKSRDELVPLLLKYIADRSSDGEDYQASLDIYAGDFLAVSDDHTSARLEVIRALSKYGARAKAAIPLLHERAADPAFPNDLPRLKPYQQAAENAARIIEAALR